MPVLQKMEIQVPTTVLQDMVQRAVKASTFVDLLPLTGLINIQVKDKMLYVRTTDNINYVTMFAQLDQPEFNVVVDAKQFANMVSRISTTETTLTVENGTLTMKANGTYNWPVAVDISSGTEVDFPIVTFTPDGSTTHITAEEVKSILSVSKSCKAVNKDTPCLFNYYFTANHCYTTDTFRACSQDIKFSDRTALISPTVMELLNVVLDTQYGIDISQNDTMIQFESPKGIVIGRKCVKADLDMFPVEDMEESFSTTLQYNIEVNRTVLLDAVERMDILTDALQQNIIQLTFHTDKLTLTNTVNQSFEDVPYVQNVKDVNGTAVQIEPVILTMNSAYLKQLLSVSTKETFSLSFNDQTGVLFDWENAKLLLGTVGEFSA